MSPGKFPIIGIKRPITISKTPKIIKTLEISKKTPNF